MIGTLVVSPPVGLSFSLFCSMTIPRFVMPDSVMSWYVTPETEPVAPYMVLIRTPVLTIRNS